MLDFLRTGTALKPDGSSTTQERIITVDENRMKGRIKQNLKQNYGEHPFNIFLSCGPLQHCLLSPFEEKIFKDLSFPAGEVILTHSLAIMHIGNPYHNAISEFAKCFSEHLQASLFFKDLYPNTAVTLNNDGTGFT